MDESVQYLTSTDEYWEVDGFPLNTYAWNIESWGNGRRKVPTLRGSNVVVPNRPGELYAQKIPEAQTITLGMWVIGCDPDGEMTRERRGTFNSNWQALYRTLWRSDRQVELTRRTKLADGSIYTDTALAEFTGGLEPSMEGPQAGRFTVDYRLADPYFYGPTITERFAAGEKVIYNDSDDVVRKLLIRFWDGENYALTNTTTGKTLGVAASGPVVVDTDKFTCMEDISGGSSILGSVQTNFNQGGAFWMSLLRGDNAFTLNSGICELEWQTLRL